MFICGGIYSISWRTNFFPTNSIMSPQVSKNKIEHKEKYSETGKNGREYFIRNFRKDIFMPKLENALASLIK